MPWRVSSDEVSAGCKYDTFADKKKSQGSHMKCRYSCIKTTKTSLAIVNITA